MHDHNHLNDAMLSDEVWICSAVDTRRAMSQEKVGVSIVMRLVVGALAAIAVSVVISPVSGADPLTPLTPDEIQYLEHAREVFAVAHDPTEFRSDGELLELGRYVCAKRAAGYVGAAATLTPPVINQLAVVHLCS